MVAMLRYDSLMTTSGVRAAATARRPAQINDLDLANWQQYDDILTDSLWVLDARDSSGAHQADYHGNFIPQIPRQMLRRFTKAGDAVLDPFVGSGTTAIEAARLGRGCVGVELSPHVARIARERIRQDELALDGALAALPCPSLRGLLVVFDTPGLSWRSLGVPAFHKDVEHANRMPLPVVLFQRLVVFHPAEFVPPGAAVFHSDVRHLRQDGAIDQVGRLDLFPRVEVIGGVAPDVHLALEPDKLHVVLHLVSSPSPALSANPSLRAPRFDGGHVECPMLTEGLGNMQASNGAAWQEFCEWQA